MTFSDTKFGQVLLDTHKLHVGMKVTEELPNEPVFDLLSYIAKEFARRIGAKEEEAFLIGDGKGKPTGVFSETGGAENGGTTSTANITFDDMIELFYSLKSPYRKKTVWLLNEQTIKMLRKIKDSNGQYIWQPSISAGIPDTILNHHYVTSVYAPTAEAGKKALAFGDFSYYNIGDRSGRSFGETRELLAKKISLTKPEKRSLHPKHRTDNAEIIQKIV